MKFFQSFLFLYVITSSIQCPEHKNNLRPSKTYRNFKIGQKKDGTINKIARAAVQKMAKDSEMKASRKAKQLPFQKHEKINNINQALYKK